MASKAACAYSGVVRVGNRLALCFLWLDHAILDALALCVGFGLFLCVEIELTCCFMSDEDV